MREGMLEQCENRKRYASPALPQEKKTVHLIKTQNRGNLINVRRKETFTTLQPRTALTGSERVFQKRARSKDSTAVAFVLIAAFFIVFLQGRAPLAIGAEKLSGNGAGEATTNRPGLLDPFRPFILPMPEAEQVKATEPRSPCQKVDLAQLKLVAILHDREVGSTAIFETPEAETCSLSEGDFLGRQDAILKYILYDCVVISEAAESQFKQERTICKCIDVFDEDICPLCVKDIAQNPEKRADLYENAQECGTNDCMPYLYVEPPYQRIRFYCKCEEGNDETCSSCLETIPDVQCMDYALEIHYKESSFPTRIVSISHKGIEPTAEFITAMGESLVLKEGDKNEPEDAVIKYILDDCVIMERPEGLISRCIDFTSEYESLECIKRLDNRGYLDSYDKFRAGVIDKALACVTDECKIDMQLLDNSRRVELMYTCEGEVDTSIMGCIADVDVDYCLMYGLQVHADEFGYPKGR